MSASRFEQELAQKSGVTIHHYLQPKGLRGDGHVAAVEFEKDGESVVLNADVVFKAIGQKLDSELAAELEGIELEHGKIVVDGSFATTMDNVWAGGDCVAGGDDLTVSAVQHGKVAAIAIDRQLRS